MSKRCLLSDMKKRQMNKDSDTRTISKQQDQAISFPDEYSIEEGFHWPRYQKSGHKIMALPKFSDIMDQNIIWLVINRLFLLTHKVD
jgi:hypothetical protein